MNIRERRDTDDVLALLSLACAAATIVAGGVWISSRFVGSGSPIIAGRSAIADSALWMTWLVAATATAGSLDYSLGAGYEPCWYQQICIYPMSLVLLVAALRRDRGIWMYAVPVSAVGLVITRNSRRSRSRGRSAV